MKYYCNVKSDILLKIYSQFFEDITVITFNVALLNEVKGDDKFQHDMLIHAIKEDNFKYYRLKQNLL